MNKVQIADLSFKIELERNDRRKFSIEVLKGKKLKVSAPDFASIDEIEARIIKKANWILFQDSSFKELPLLLPKRMYFTGESYYLLGEQYSLIVQNGHDNVELRDRKIYLNISDDENSAEVFNEWLIDFANSYLEEKFLECLKIFQLKIGVDINPRLSIREMKKRWGSCSPNNLITLNIELISAREKHIEYVIFHELTHTLHLDHSDKFYKTLSKVCSSYVDDKRELDLETQLFEK